MNGHPVPSLNAVKQKFAPQTLATRTPPNDSGILKKFWIMAEWKKDPLSPVYCLENK